MTRFLDLEDALRQVKYLGFHVRDLGLLQGCLARPETTLFGDDAYPTLSHKAAALLHSVATSHPLIDGNKRTAWALLVTFLVLNDYEVITVADEGVEFVLAVATDSLELDEIAHWLSSRLKVSPLR
ncbi:DOC-like toxin [Pontimonas salivibrio]|jgi:death-on-curing protein|uniref:DOC-like toxin n=1 Tax=Pontimonas salivibrio TaxID=1159327 RepID=A0A2L2BPP9_9MICO|nr:type II toxin-antitoxin system death-on-curing family toxin [Pontimonas salivibrio]AVG23650.1 DOC-like toxin [Pontimonas salivibrio]